MSRLMNRGGNDGSVSLIQGIFPNISGNILGNILGNISGKVYMKSTTINCITSIVNQMVETNQTVAMTIMR